MRIKVLKNTLIVLSIIMLTSSISYCNELDISAKSAILIDAESGRVLYSINSQEKMPMASTTKIMTALVAIENGNMNDMVKIKRESVGVEGSSIYLFEGEEISKEDLLYGLMLRSGNDAAIAIANHIGGNTENFINIMNNRSKEIGALNTNFVNPHGLDDENHYTTTYDLALITKEALKINEFKDIVGTKTWVANRLKNNYFYNKNKTIYQYDGGNGVKTGYTKETGRCLVSSATRKGMQLIAVVLNDSNWFNDCYELLDYGFENYNPYILYDKGQFIRNLPVKKGKKLEVPVITEEICAIPLNDIEIDKIKIVVNLPEELKAPIYSGLVVGKIVVYMNGEILHSTNLITKYDVGKENIINRLLRSPN